MTLRVLAAARVPRHRAGLLREAVDVLQGAGDRLELAGALADLYQAHRAMGESRGADAVHRHALRLARSAGPSRCSRPCCARRPTRSPSRRAPSRAWPPVRRSPAWAS